MTKTIEAWLDTTCPAVDGYDLDHDVDAEKVAGIKARILSADCYPFAPVLLVEDAGNGSKVLDGHHRIEAFREIAESFDHDEHWAWQADIPAYVVDAEDFEAIAAEIPAGRLGDYDEYIMAGGKPYAHRAA